jgi:hypothetical protein
VKLAILQNLNMGFFFSHFHYDVTAAKYKVSKFLDSVLASSLVNKRNMIKHLQVLAHLNQLVVAFIRIFSFFTG